LIRLFARPGLAAIDREAPSPPDWDVVHVGEIGRSTSSDSLGEPTSPPRLMPARGPPLWEMQDSGSEAIDPQAQPEPDYEFDQRIAW